jgi:filamentous hemagglutinin family protein
VTPGVLTESGVLDRIDGGAIRGDVLFHSFSDFNVNDGQRVYFANPAVIDTILGRVTGVNPSAIFGTLGVLGNADLIFINPNGIIFGPNAVLDVRGSFVGSTTDAVTFSNGYQFSTVNPGTPPLLTVNGSLGLASWLPPQTGAIASSGNLGVGQDLTLTGNMLDVQGSLSAGGDLSLLAAESLFLQDSAVIPVVAIAGNTLLLQGNQTLDVALLNHPDSGLLAGGDLILRSDGVVTGDARFQAGGDFRVEQVSGAAGNLASPQDPVVRASGDVAFDSYTGASLHILAGGNVAIGNVVITGPDALGNGLQESVPLSDGSGAIAINGNTQPTLDVRAGTLAVGTPGITPPTAPGFVPPLPNPNGTPTGANITIGSVTNPSGLVLITNQYQPNLTLTGDITVGTLNTSANPTARLPGGDVAIDSRGALTVSNINVSGGSFSVTPGTNAPRLSTINVGGNSGNVTLLADGTLTLPYPATIYALGLRGGEISLASDTTIVQANAPFGVNAQTLSWVESLSVAPVPGGDLRLSAPTILVGGNLLTTHLGRGTGGDIVLNSGTLVTNQASINTRLVGTGTGGDVLVTTSDLQHTPFSSIGAFNFGGGQGGNVVVQAETLTATGGAQIGAATSGVGAAGDVTVTADTIAL